MSNSEMVKDHFQMSVFRFGQFFHWKIQWILSLIIFIHQMEGTTNKPNYQYPSEFPIGSLFDRLSDPVGQTALMYAVSINNHAHSGRRGITFSLLSEKVDINNAFAVTSTMCGQMSSGIFVIYGATSLKTFHTFQAYSAKFHMPFITPDLPGDIPQVPVPQVIFAKPDYTKAIADLIGHLRWSRLDYVYDSDAGLQRAQKVHNLLNHRIYIGFKRLSNISSAHEDLRRLDLLARPDENEVELSSLNMVIDLSSYQAYNTLLRQIPEVGMNRDGYNYILGTLDMLGLDIMRFLHGGVQVYGFQVVAYETALVRAFMEDWSTLEPGIWPGAGSDVLTMDAALPVDMLNAVVKALESMVAKKRNVFSHVFRRGKVYNMNDTVGIQCTADPILPWMHGEEIYESLKKVNFEGLSGHVEFDKFGRRVNYTFDIVSVGREGVNKLGVWHSKIGILQEQPLDLPYPIMPPDTNRTTPEYPWGVKIISTIIEEPFLFWRPKEETDENGNPLLGNNRFRGYSRELAFELAKRIPAMAEYALVPVADNEYGRELPNRTWTGMIGDLVHGRAHLAIGPLTITTARERVVDFSKPFMNIGISMMAKRPEKQKPGLFSFMEPFSLTLWASIFVAYITISLTIFIVSRYSPYENKRRHTYRDHYRYNFTLCNSFWFAMGALMLQGSDLCPRSVAGRIIGGVWWFFVLIIISSYTANLAAFLTIERMNQPISSAEDLVKQSEIAYGILETGSTRTFFEESNVSTYSQMWAYMQSAKPPVMVKTLEEGVKRVQDSGGKYIFLLESSTNDYINNRKPCDTVRVGTDLNLEGFGIATPHGSDLREEIIYASLKLKEDGTLHKMKQKWWQEKGECNIGNKESKKRSLSLSNVAGAFLLLITGLVVSIATGLFEAHYYRMKGRNYNMDPYDGSSVPSHGYSNGGVVIKRVDT